LIQNTPTTEIYPFSNFAVTPTDEVYLRLNLKDALFLVQKIANFESCFAPLYERLASDFNGSSVKISYVEALGAVQSLLKSAVK
jgi:hypothetical protein